MKTSMVPIVLLVLAGAAFGQAADAGKFYPPQGWTVAKQPNGTVAVQAPGVAAGKTCARGAAPSGTGSSSCAEVSLIGPAFPYSSGTASIATCCKGGGA